MSKRKFATKKISSKPHRRMGSEDKPLAYQTKEPMKREVLKRLFGRQCQNNQNYVHRQVHVTKKEFKGLLDENDDPLLGNVPPNMEPEALGFLMCLQETMYFLYIRNFEVKDSVKVELRAFLLDGLAEIAVA